MISISKSFKKDLTNQTFGRLTVLEFVPNDRKLSHWLCECSCERQTKRIVQGVDLISGHTKSCGCISKEKLIENNKKRSLDLVGQVFGRLTVIEKTDKRQGKNIIWKCRCNCDNKIIEISGGSLTRANGNTESCGCINSNNLLGQKFGKLTVIKKTEKRTDKGNIIWECQCSCSKKTIKEVSSHSLIHGNTQSCGCISYSIGEKNIQNILDNNNIKYTFQAKFDDLIAPDTKAKLKFDFVIYDDKIKYVIEFDGIHHVEPIEYWGGIERLERQQRNDRIKNKYCKDNNIPIIRIPYKERDNITLELIQLETTPYLFIV